MKSNYIIAITWLGLFYPLAIVAQWGGGGNRGGRNRPDWVAPVIDPVVEGNAGGDNGGDMTTTALPPTDMGGSTTNDTPEDTPADTPADTPEDTPTGGSTGGGSSGECGGAVDGNMNVRISGDSVSYRLEPPVPGNPTTGTIGDCDVWSFPVGWNGRVHIGGGSGAPDGGTLFEGNAISNSVGAMDVSYVEGFSVPMMCTDEKTGFKSGCGIDLFSVGTCPTGGSAGGVCKNPQGPGGDRDSADTWCEACSPPDPFFAPCAAAAYTFPTDDAAVQGQSGLEITCVVGASGETTSREGDTAETGNPQSGRCEVCSGSTATKRSLENVIFGRGVQPPSARTPSMLPRAHRRSAIDILEKRSHLHGLAHGSKV